ncbi:MAG: GYD domain-containing protein [Salinirussus sp.]
MATQTTAERYVALIDVDEPGAQNVQELAAIWGEIDNELDEIGVTVESSYTVLGEVDFIMIFEASDRESAFQADTVLGRRGLDVQTMEITPTEEFAQLVDEI